MVDIMLKFKADMDFEGRGLMLLEDAYYMQSCACSSHYYDENGVYRAKAVAEDGEHVVVYWELLNDDEVQFEEDDCCDWVNPVCVEHDNDFDFDPDEYEEIEFD